LTPNTHNTKKKKKKKKKTGTGWAGGGNVGLCQKYFINTKRSHVHCRYETLVSA
jgi:hypothetical protein